MRPQSISEIKETLLDLARLGAVPSATPYSLWLRVVGAIQSNQDANWLYTDRTWLRTATPASGPLDLLRRTAVLDPHYRFHLDVLVAEVLQTIASTARWNRFEELIFGPLLHFAPRFVQLLESAASTLRTSPADLSASSWQQLAEQVEGKDGGTFHAWDCELWGDVPGGAAALFPVLVDAYVPLRRHGCTVAADQHAVDDSTAQLLAGLIERAKNGEGISAEVELEPRLRILLGLGLPIRMWIPDGAVMDRRPIVGLVEPVRLAWHGNLRGYPEGSPLTGVDKAHLRTAAVDQGPETGPDVLTEGFWSAVENSVSAVAFPGLCLSEDWPTTRPNAPVWSQIPSSKDFGGVDVARKGSVEVDQALFMLARHLLFGLLLQIFLLESLDRELGHESLALAPPVQDGLAGFRTVQVFYRPTQEQGPDVEQQMLPAYELGSFESVLDSISKGLGIMPAGLTFDGDGDGFWSTAAGLLASLNIVTLSASKDRWILHATYLDRLHGGGLMAGVLRRGKNVRDRIRGHLHHLWSAANDLNHQIGALDV